MIIGIWLSEYSGDAPTWRYDTCGDNDPSKDAEGEKLEIQALFGAIRSLQGFVSWMANARGTEL